MFPQCIFFCGLWLLIYFVPFLLKIEFLHQDDWRTAMFGGIGGLCLGPLVAWLAVHFHPVIVSEEGICGYSVLGHRRFLCWHEIQTVKTIRFANLTMLRLDSGKPSSTTWITLPVKHPLEFQRAIRQLAPPENPIHGFDQRSSKRQREKRRSSDELD